MSHETSISHCSLLTDLFRHFRPKIRKTQIQLTQNNNRIDNLSCNGEKFEKTVNKRQTTKKLGTAPTPNFPEFKRLVKEHIVNAPPSILESLKCHFLMAADAIKNTFF